MGCAQIDGASAAYRDLLRIRTTERAFSLATAGQVQSKLSFPLSGKDETPGVITMGLGDLVVVFNATPRRTEQRIASLAGKATRCTRPAGGRGPCRQVGSRTRGNRAPSPFRGVLSPSSPGRS